MKLFQLILFHFFLMCQIAVAQVKHSGDTSLPERLPAAVIRPLQPGDSVPLHYLNKLSQFDTASAGARSLEKLYVLDFWATWCTNCLYNFPKLDSLQQVFGNQLQVVLVNTNATRDDENKIKSYFKKRINPNGHAYQFASIVNDTLWSRFFPHKLLPHYVWIYKGKVKAITDAQFVNKENIDQLFSFGSIQLPVKKDVVVYDNSKPLFVEESNELATSIQFRSMITSYLSGKPTASSISSDNNGKLTRICYTNSSILHLYQMAFRARLPGNRTILEVADPVKLTAKQNKEWFKELTWSYELITPPVDHEKALERMKYDLKHFFGYNASVEKKMLDCLVLKKTGTVKYNSKSLKDAYSNLSEDSPEKFIQNQPVKILVNWLNQNLHLPVIDESDYLLPVTLTLNNDPKNLKELQSTLKKQGFELLETKREVKIFVVSEK